MDSMRWTNSCCSAMRSEGDAVIGIGILFRQSLPHHRQFGLRAGQRCSRSEPRDNVKEMRAAIAHSGLGSLRQRRHHIDGPA